MSLIPINFSCSFFYLVEHLKDWRVWCLSSKQKKLCILNQEKKTNTNITQEVQEHIL